MEKLSSSTVACSAIHVYIWTHTQHMQGRLKHINLNTHTKQKGVAPISSYATGETISTRECSQDQQIGGGTTVPKITKEIETQ